MSQRPTIKKPTPLSEPAFRKGADPVMGGVNIPSFSAEMQAEVSPEAAPLWNFVLSHARVIAAGVVAIERFTGKGSATLYLNPSKTARSLPDGTAIEAMGIVIPEQEI